MPAMNLLVVDDNVINQKLLRAQLEAEGHRVRQAANGLEALAVLEREPVDAVISDILMPRMDGYRLCFEIRTSERFRHLPVIIYTATLTSTSDEQLCRDLGADAYLRKPVPIHELLRAVRAALAGERPRPQPAFDAAHVLEEYNERLAARLEQKNLALVRTQEALVAAQARLHQLLAHSPAVLYALKLEGEQMVPYMISENISRLLGFEVAEALSFEWWKAALHPQDASRALAGVEETRRLGFARVEYRMRHKNGAWQWVEDNRRLVRGPTGEPAEMVGVWNDISERKRAEAAQARLVQIVNSSSDAIIGMTTDGTITDWNRGAERIFGYTAAEALGRPVSLVCLPESAEACRQEMAEIAGGQGDTIEAERVRKDGTRIFVSATRSPVLDRDGRVVGICEIGRDVTEQRKLEERLRQTQKLQAIGELAGGIAHDFNNLLTIINGYSEMMLQSGISGAQRQHVEQIGEAGKRAAALTRKLLAFSRRQVLETKTLDLNDVVRRSAELLRRLVGERYQIEPALAPDLRPIKADEVQIEQVLMNLVINARDAMADGGKIRIETDNVELDAVRARQRCDVPAGEYAMIAVTDSGCGMDEATQQRIFEPFFTTKPPGQGTGLGLATVLGIVKQSNGAISVYSEVGRGTTVRVYFPALRDAVAPRVEKPKAAAAGGETILVVDDDAGVREFAGEALASHGYRLLLAESPEAALRLCADRAQHIDLLISDVVMPRMTGPELARELRRRQPGLKVLYVSGYPGEMVRDEMNSGDGAEYLTKPYTIGGLADKVRSVLDNGGGGAPA